ncbi:hypothetical protein Tco_0258134, partial [Tanacetum coccineum]
MKSVQKESTSKWGKGKRVNYSDPANDMKNTFVSKGVLVSSGTGYTVRPHDSTARPKVSTDRPKVSTDRPNVGTARHNVGTARPNVHTNSLSTSTSRPFVQVRPQSGGYYPRMDNVRPRVSTSPPNRHYHPRTDNVRPRASSFPINRFYTQRIVVNPNQQKGFQNLTTAGKSAVANNGKS